MDLKTASLENLIDESLELVKTQTNAVNRAVDTLIPLDFADDPDTFAQSVQLIQLKLAEASRHMEAMRSNLHKWWLANQQELAQAKQKAQSLQKQLGAETLELN